MALSWYLKAAEQADPLAQFALGCLFEAGAGTAVPKSIPTALDWYAKAAEAADPLHAAPGGVATAAGQPAGGGGDAADSAVARAGRMALARLRVVRESPRPALGSPAAAVTRGTAAAGGGAAAAALLLSQALAAAAAAAAAAPDSSEEGGGGDASAGSSGGSTPVAAVAPGAGGLPLA